MKVFLLILLGFSIFINADQLDSEYSQEFTDLIELVYGSELLSQGGNESIERMFSEVELNDKKLLDIGSGLGGVDFYIAERYTADITGVDCVARLVTEANNRKSRRTLRGSVNFIHQEADHFVYPWEDNSFDIIFSKESLLHVADKKALCKELYRILKPGGKIIVLDWLTESHSLGSRIQEMMAMDGLDLKMATLSEYKDTLTFVGFSNISSSCLNEEYIRYTQDNIERIKSCKTQLIQRLGLEGYNYSLKTWTLQQQIFAHKEVLVTLMNAVK